MHTAGECLLLVVSPAARALDGESVRVARDVLSAGASVKVAFPDGAADLDRVLAHRGRRRPVVIGDDRALHQVLRALHRQRALADAVGVVPVGRGEMVSVARALGVPPRPVDAARTVLSGAPRSLDLLTDESGGVVLGAVRIPGRGGTWRAAPASPSGPPAPPTNGTGGPAGRAAAASGAGQTTDGRSLRANSRVSAERDGAGLFSALARTVARAMPLALPGAGCPRLRVEADGHLLADLDRPLRHVSVWNAPPAPHRGVSPDDGYAEVLVRAEGAPLRVRAREITVTGADFGYVADGSHVGPVRARTWTVVPHAWRLTLPR